MSDNYNKTETDKKQNSSDTATFKDCTGYCSSDKKLRKDKSIDKSRDKQ